jgi:hypothetical protein
MFIPNIIAQNIEIIRSLNPEEQEVSINRDLWESVSIDINLDEILGKNKHAISRNRILSIAPKFDPYNLISCNQAYPDLKKLFIAVMIWGYARTGYGPHRVAKMLKSPNLKKTLCEVSRAVAFGMYGSAYDSFRKAKIPELGPSFASKFLYFCSATDNYPIKALIFDSRVASSLRKSDFPTDYSYYLTKNPKDDSFVKWNTKGYLQYLILMHNWASRLNCKAVQIELFLFNYDSV